MSYIADKKEKCPGFFLVATLSTTYRPDKLLFFAVRTDLHNQLKKMLLGNWNWDIEKTEFKTGEPKVNLIISIAVFLSVYPFLSSCILLRILN